MQTNQFVNRRGFFVLGGVAALAFGISRLPSRDRSFGESAAKTESLTKEVDTLCVQVSDLGMRTEIMDDLPKSGQLRSIREQFTLVAKLTSEVQNKLLTNEKIEMKTDAKGKQIDNDEPVMKLLHSIKAINRANGEIVNALIINDQEKAKRPLRALIRYIEQIRSELADVESIYNSSAGAAL